MIKKLDPLAFPSISWEMDLLGLIVFQTGPQEPNKESGPITLLPPSNKARNYPASELSNAATTSE